MALQSTLVGFPETDPQVSTADLVRDRVALRASRMNARFPQAVDLEAEVLTALAEPLRGVAALLAGTHCPEHFREALRGERSLPLGDLCRLATDPTREARTATLAALQALARALGCSVQPVAAAPSSLVESAISAASVATDALGDVTRAVADGQVDPSEAASLRSRAAELRHAAAAFEGAALRAEEVRR